MREALASILAARGAIDDAKILELYAGTGACSFELLSRGAAHAVLVERDARAAKDLADSARELELDDRTTCLRLDLDTQAAVTRIPSGPYDLVLADPPYDVVLQALTLLESLAVSGRLAARGLVVLEHRTKDASSVDRAIDARDVTSSRLSVVSRYRYGDTTLSLLASETARSEPDLESNDA